MKERDRNKQILETYREGKTLQQTGRIFGVSRERIRQIILIEIKKEIQKEFNLSRLTKLETKQLDVAARNEIRDIYLNRILTERKNTEQRIREKMKRFPPYSAFSTSTQYSKALGEKVDDIKKCLPDIIYYNRKKKWSRLYNKCRECGTTSIKHHSYGLCKNCYIKSDHFKEMQANSRMRNKDKWKVNQKRYAKEYFDKKNFNGNREKAIERNNYRCVGCGLSRKDSYKKFGKDLYVKHIKDPQDNSLSNLVTLCAACSKKKYFKSANGRTKEYKINRTINPRMLKKEFLKQDKIFVGTLEKRIYSECDDAGKILQATAREYNTNSRSLIGKSRKEELVFPRHLAIYMLREKLSLSFPQIGKIMGERDHTSIIYAYKKISKLAKN